MLIWQQSSVAPAAANSIAASIAELNAELNLNMRTQISAPQ